MKKKIYIALFVLTATLLNLQAQENYFSQIKIDNRGVAQTDGQLGVDINFDVSDLRINSQHAIALTPILVSADGLNSATLPAVIVNGAVRHKVTIRNYKLNNKSVYDDAPYAVVPRKNRSAQVVPYNVTVPMEEWMKDASLRVKEEVLGCASCELVSTDHLITERVISEAYVPVYKLTYIVPEVEPVKARADKYTATINFYVNKHDIVRDYKNNAAVLDEVDKVVSKIVSNNDLTVSDFEISGYASPEAPVAYNKALSDRRANAFADYLSSKFNVARSRMKITGGGEDWITTREVIAASNISDKGEILRIIDNVANPDARDGELKKLSGGRIYQTMLRDYYPQIRRTVYTVSYVVRAFDVEEAKEIIRTNPKMLSLNEMYLVAHSYAPDSKEFKEVFDIATRLYPAESVAILNSAAADIEGGNNQAAINRLEKINDNPKAWNNLGVAYARLGNIEKAGEYFAKASANGDADAKYNVGELEKIIETTNH